MLGNQSAAKGERASAQLPSWRSHFPQVRVHAWLLRLIVAAHAAATNPFLGVAYHECADVLRISTARVV